MKMRHRKIYALLLTAVLAGTGSSTILAQTPTGVRIHGSVFGGGNEADVKINTTVNIGGGTIDANVYGGGNLGDVGTIDKTDINNYVWSNYTDTETNNDTGICTVTITGGTIGGENISTADYASGHVFGAGKGLEDTWWCEKGMVYKTSVSISNGTVYGNVYGGGQVGRVENNAVVTIGTSEETGNIIKPNITGNVFGAGAGVKTHGYSALVRGDATVTVQGVAQVGGSVYGGGEIASVGRFTVVGGLPKHPDSGGNCTVTIQDNAKIGSSGTDHNVFGACKGVTPAYEASGENRSKSMQLATNAPSDASLWSHYNNDETSPFIWRYYKTEADYLDFLETLALTSHPIVTIVGNAEVNGSVYGGGERGITLGSVEVNMNGGTVAKDVYGGGALANSNKGNWDTDKYVEATGLVVGTSVVTGMYTRSGNDPYVYTEITDADTKAASGTTYYVRGAWTDDTKKSALYTTEVNLNGGLIKGDAYGGGLGQLGNNPIQATVYGDVKVNQGKANDDTAPATAYKTELVNTTDLKKDANGDPIPGDYVQVVNSGRIFGCNNLNGSPKGNVTVTINKTVTGKDVNGNDLTRTEITRNSTTKEVATVATPHKYEVAAVYGGGNLAEYSPIDGQVKVIINSCDVSVEEVYGGGNAAKVPSTDVLVKGAHEIEHVFGGGNGEDKYTLDGGTTWIENPGADIGGDANTLITGGLVHEAYGGSNEKGTIDGDITIDTGTGGLTGCPVKVDKLVGAGKNADVNGNLIMVLGCYPTTKTPLIFAGADNANVNGNVELTITSGTFGQVFGGNNVGGAIKGYIKLNIEETGCNPIVIDELYLGGNNAAYSRYGYYVKTTTSEGENAAGVGASNETAVLTDGKLTFVPRTSDTDPHLPVKTYTKTGDTWTWTTDAISGENAFEPYAQPVLNVTSCTRIDKVFGGGYGAGGDMYADPTVNINMIPGVKFEGVPGVMTNMGLTPSDNPDNLGIIGDVYGGGNAADVIGNPTVNIGTAPTVDLHLSYDKTTGAYTWGKDKEVKGAFIKGNVFGAGMGKDDTFTCEKAMVGKDGDGVDHPDGGTTVNIYKGTVRGNVYGGGEIGRVEKNTLVTIGTGDGSETGTREPVIKGSVYGGGKGKETHGYAALVRGNPTVTVQGNAKVEGSVYGGGEIASVARYQVVNGVPVALAQVKEGQHSGYCTVEVKGYAEIGPYGMKMYHVDANGNIANDDKPDDWGHVFGAGKGVLPKNYTYADNENRPKRMMAYDDTKYTASNQAYWEYADAEQKNVWEYFPDETKYFEFIETLALSTHTDVTIDGHAFVKGSVYGGSENGMVQYDTDVKVKGYCQIGNGDGVDRRYTETEWGYDGSTVDKSLAECASWVYGLDTNNDGVKDLFAPYDPHANATGDLDRYPAVGTAEAKSTEGGRKIASDGHTYYGNVFGGGSGSVPYFDTAKGISRYIMTAGQVKGNTKVTIDGGHILTNVYGGCEATNVLGKATIKMTGGTLGVPRTLAQIDAHPVTCYLFGAGKGDQRIFFNKDTNVEDVEIKITGGQIFGSVFGGGEDGHVHRNVTMTIGMDDHTGPKIGTWGTSYVDGNVFGGGRGFGGDAYTAGNIAGSVTMNIKGGTMLGSVYGGGRLGSVGYGLFDAETNGQPTPGYGEMRPDNTVEESNPTSADDFKRGYVDINISGGTIGNSLEYIVPNATNIANAGITETDIKKWDDTNKYWAKWKEYHNIPKTEFDTTTGQLAHTKGGNVFAGGMGRLYQLDGKTPISSVDWWKLGNVKSTKLTISGDAKIYSNVYGGGELGMVQGGTHTSEDNKAVSTEIIIKGGIIGTEVKNGEDVEYTFGSVFGGGYGSLVEKLTHTGGKPDSYPKFIAGRVKGSTSVTTMTGNNIAVKASVYGGGEMAAVGESKVLGETITEGLITDTYVTINGGTIGKSGFGGAKMGNVYGGGSGHYNTVRSGHIYGNTNVTISGSPTIYHNIYGGGAYGTVGDFVYTVDPANDKATGINGLHEDRTGTGTATITITGGTIGVDGHENGMVFGSSRGDINKPGERDDNTAWVYDANVIIGNNDGSGPQINGSVYGSGENGHTFHNTNVNMLGGTIGIASGSPVNGQSGAAYPYRGNVYGGGCGTDKYYSGAVPDGHKANDGNGDTYNPLAGIVYGDATVNIKGGTVVRNVYGAGAMGSVNKKDAASATGGKTTVIVSGGHVGVDGNDNGHVFGAARGDLTVTPENYATVRTTEVSVKSNADIKGSVFGGGEAGLVWENVTVNMLGGSVAKDVYGGGAFANTQAANNNEGNTTSTFKTTVNVLGGTVNDVYGGGLGQVGKAAVAAQGTPGEEGYVPAQAAVTAVEAKVYGDVTVNLNGLESANYVEADHGSLVTDIDPTDGTYYRATDGCIVTGNVFGCNNVNGTPEGHAKVHVFKTVSAGHEHGYDVTNVFGGGNQADYVPKATETKQSTEVIIEGCDLTKIQQVYGGGNAAATPGTLVLIKGTKIIDEVFGGGNGFSATDNHTDPTAENYNPGANVGYHTDKSEYKDSQGNYIGDGKSLVQLMAGTVNYVYGGSNSEGDIRGGSSVTNVKNDNSHGCCDKMTVKEIYAGGKNANMKGGANIVMGCYNSNDWIEEIYAGAKNANVGGDVSLTLTSGKYGRVFGGNKESGILDGSITVNIEENGVCGIPLIIGELYGGGNKAPYSIYGYNSDGTVKTSASGTDPHASPVVNVRGFTSIGNIFGGGYGEKAVMYGSPTININEAAISHTNLDNVYANGYAGETIHFVNDVLVKTVPEGTDPSTVYSVAVPAHDNGKMGTINNVFGGGNAAKVYGNTNVNIGTTASEKLVDLKSSGDPDYENDTNGNPTTTPKRTEKTVVGADIRGNVYGGGNNAEVTGNTNVNIGKATTTTTP